MLARPLWKCLTFLVLCDNIALLAATDIEERVKKTSSMLDHSGWSDYMGNVKIKVNDNVPYGIEDLRATRVDRDNLGTKVVRAYGLMVCYYAGTVKEFLILYVAITTFFDSQANAKDQSNFIDCFVYTVEKIRPAIESMKKTLKQIKLLSPESDFNEYYLTEVELAIVKEHVLTIDKLAGPDLPDLMGRYAKALKDLDEAIDGYAERVCAVSDKFPNTEIPKGSRWNIEDKIDIKMDSFYADRVLDIWV